MNRRFVKSLCVMLTMLLALPAFAQDNKDWEPTGVWPFINKQFRPATVYTGLFKRTKTIVPCNIHVEKQALWYSQNDTLMEAIPGTVIRVEFPNGDTYMPVGSEQRFGRIIREDSIDGSVARIILVRQLDRHELDEKYLGYFNKTQGVQQGTLMIGGVAANFSGFADSEAGKKMEEEPLPLVNVFYFQVHGEIFPATTKNILENINPSRKREYKNFTRSAEIISTNESSMLKIWKEFFLKR